MSASAQTLSLADALARLNQQQDDYEISFIHNDLIWNARLARPFLKGKLVVRLDCFDLLGQLDNVTRHVNAQGRTETYTNVMPRYALFHIAYRFNRMPKKK